MHGRRSCLPELIPFDSEIERTLQHLASLFCKSNFLANSPLLEMAGEQQNLITTILGLAT